jgi:erythromycin esterase-like protein
MADTLDALLGHLDAPVVVWAHNSHVGDARGSEMGWRRDELNLGQLARERHGDDVRIVGFTTATGTVTAARDWDEPGREREVRPPLRGSLERLLHQRGASEAVLDLRGGELAGQELLQRFIGVVYRPESERASHYLHTRPAEQYDVLVHVDRSSALPALDRAVGREPADLFPSGQ